MWRARQRRYAVGRETYGFPYDPFPFRTKTQQHLNELFVLKEEKRMIEVAVLSPRTGVALAACCSLILLRKKNPKTQLQKTTKTWHTKQQFFRTQMPPSLFRLCFYRYREGGERERESSGNKQIDPGAFLFGGRCPRLKKKLVCGGVCFFSF